MFVLRMGRYPVLAHIPANEDEERLKRDHEATSESSSLKRRARGEV